MAFELPDLGYDYDSLEPHLDALTMEIHHSKHHNAYTNNLNAAIAGTEMEGKSIEDLLANHTDSPAVRNNGGGFWNHALFWNLMSPNGGGEPTGAIADAINSAFGSFEQMKAEFSNAAVTRFGSGWAWLSVSADGTLVITSTPNQDNPLMDGSGSPVLAVDVWEHAYYKKFGPARADYLSAWWNVVNWDTVNELYQSAQQ
ncbi:MAG TPA: superoxide dismutase [Candidatus Poseidoniales archaeon]|nr:MAG: superoxide dismutase [Euryarchaeota archaeon]HHZ74132.1 superoxide dismutase [Candidatus Poseidoniales archaeon]PXY75560.1 MAG: superoxide dismutase [Euryarchaeota archaeon]PXY77895.1 MAG: superoxide dismutase [Euryarchaeota archaeon]PXY79526.1 MAG: superoxide dismutase [Euryarchaeota archaeon]